MKEFRQGGSAAKPLLTTTQTENPKWVTEKRLKCKILPEILSSKHPYYNGMDIQCK